MAFGRRKEIGNVIKNALLNINGNVSTYDSSYQYNNNLYGNVERGLKFIDEIDDFPSVFIQLTEESRNYQSSEFVTADMPVIIRIYVKSNDDPQEDLESISQDIEHVLDSMSLSSELGIMDITIDSISKDEGLLTPFGYGELFITVFYVLDT